MQNDKQRIAVIGFGAMARSLQASFRRAGDQFGVAATLVPEEFAPTPSELGAVKLFNDVSDLIDWRPSLVVECASHDAVRDYVPALLRKGIDTIIVSVGSLSEKRLLDSLEAAATEGRSRLTAVSGAIGGLDVLRSARSAGLSSVAYTGTKPPSAWTGTPAADIVDLASLSQATAIFQGNAEQAARLYPKNANVTAAVALAGIGFEATQVVLIADPSATANSHRVEAQGAFGSFKIELQNKPLPDNPKTSWLAALSVEEAIVRHFRAIDV
ncbi:aspartate dehydrogenase [Rhizobium sp. SRDI969]|uniref:aspartate dehydrogenase n=1 Tax=Rhizobium sp. SRDI969 TaxID=3138252 RepID=UPI0021A40ACB|nr:aspartate dehydrogenase [Rhizobium leguminosarum]UWM84845.1 aspartate dehydrogenase [Rhizobium leguminosarum bv. viciae]